MKKYKITIANGGYQLSFTCDTISDAYGCLRSMVKINPDALMIDLVSLYRGSTNEYLRDGYSITVLEEED